MKSFWLAGALGLVLGIVGGGAVAASAIAKKRADARAGWNLKPVIVASVDISEGTDVTFDVLSQRSVPEQFVSASVVVPDEAKLIIGKKIAVPMQAGDPITWQSFVGDDTRVKECTEKIDAAVVAAGDAVREGEAVKFAQGLAPLPSAGEVRVPKGDVVVTAQDISEGTVLTAAMLKPGPYVKDLITASNVPAERLSELVGKTIVVPIQASDAVMWQMLDSGQRPRSPRSCELAVRQATHEARERAAKQEVDKL